MIEDISPVGIKQRLKLKFHSIYYGRCLAFAFVVVFAVLLVLPSFVVIAERDVDHETGACACCEPDHEIKYSLRIGEAVGNTQITIAGIQPVNFVVPDGLSWLEYGTHGFPIAVFYMGGTPDVAGIYLMSFDVIGVPFVGGHYHITFEIYN